MMMDLSNENKGVIVICYDLPTFCDGLKASALRATDNLLEVDLVSLTSHGPPRIRYTG